jgi:hypothetical protein
MRKIAAPQDLQTELRRLLAYSQEHQPSRQVVASELRGLADRVAATSDQYLAGDAADLVAASDIQIRKLQILTRECKEKPDLANYLKHAMKGLVDADASLRTIEHKLKAG